MAGGVIDLDKVEEKPHIRIADENVVRPDNPRPSLHRNASNSSMSIRSGRSSRVVSPEAVLPITYRTLFVLSLSLLVVFIRCFSNTYRR